ncbi:MAG: phosphoribosylformylglycinamidine synthase subunit PurS [Bdellovibrionaceae bacterium]|nr:phosphoribosylformylglycinamidine synthase subunit PurS [Pseudobdellovibrionaceae bacterium]
MFKFGIRILPRPEVLDTQGRAVEATLKSLGHSVLETKVGRYVQLSIEAKDIAQAQATAKKVSEEVLCNMLIENFEIEVLK